MGWFRKAAEQSHVVAQYTLGVMYSHSDAVANDAAEAMRWYRAAADQGYPAAQYSVGLGYRDGEGVPQDIAEAMASFARPPTTVWSWPSTASDSPTATGTASPRAIPWR